MPGFISFSLFLFLVAKVRVFLAAHDPLSVVKTFLSFFLSIYSHPIYGLFGSDLVPLISFRIYFFLLSTHTGYAMPAYLINGYAGVVGVLNNSFICLDVGRLRRREISVVRYYGVKQTPVVEVKRVLPVRRSQVLPCPIDLVENKCTLVCCLLPPLQVNLLRLGRLAGQEKVKMVFTNHSHLVKELKSSTTYPDGEMRLLKNYELRKSVVGETASCRTLPKGNLEFVGEIPWLVIAAEWHRHEELRTKVKPSNEPE